MHANNRIGSVEAKKRCLRAVALDKFQAVGLQYKGADLLQIAGA